MSKQEKWLSKCTSWQVYLVEERTKVGMEVGLAWVTGAGCGRDGTNALWAMQELHKLINYENLDSSLC